MLADFTIDPSAVALVVAAVVAIAAAGWYGKQRGTREAQSDTTKSMQERISNQEGMLEELRTARDDDRAEFERRLTKADKAHLEEALLCRENIARLRGQLEAVTGGLVEQVGEALGEQIDKAARDVAVTVGDRVIAHLNGAEL